MFFNLIVDDALSSFPAYIIQFIRRICSFCNAGHRSARLKELQLRAGVREPLEIPNYVESRWESLLNCVERILKLWPFLDELLRTTD